MMSRLRAFVGQSLGRADLLPDSETWRSGDQAECVYAGPWFRGGTVPVAHGPVLGEVRRVAEVSVRRYRGRRLQFLAFARYGSAVYAAAYFRKIVPAADVLEAADATFLQDLAPATRPELVPADFHFAEPLGDVAALLRIEARLLAVRTFAADVRPALRIITVLTIAAALAVFGHAVLLGFASWQGLGR